MLGFDDSFLCDEGLLRICSAATFTSRNDESELDTVR